MKLMFVRHAEPDYKHDSLTLKGHREAQLLSLRLAKLDVRDFYASPTGACAGNRAVHLGAHAPHGGNAAVAGGVPRAEH